MNISIHDVTRIRTGLKQLKDDKREFLVRDIEIETENGLISISLFGDTKEELKIK